MKLTLAFTLTARLLTAQAAPVEQAKMYFSAGQQAYEARQYLVAATAFEQAYELSPQPAILFSTAQAYRLHFLIARRPEHLEKAIGLYREYLVRAPAGSRRTDAAEHLATLEIRLAQLGGTKVAPSLAEARPTQIMIASRTPGAQASVGDSDLQPVPVVKNVSPGPHRVRVERDGFFPEEAEVTAVEGRLVVRDILLTERPGRLTVSTETGAEVLVDGRPMGEAPLGRALLLPSGRHLVVVRALGKRTSIHDIVLERGKETYLHVLLEETGQRTLSYWVLGTGAAAFAASIGTGAAALIFRGRAQLYLLERDDPDTRLTLDDLELYRRDRSRQRDFGRVFWATLSVSAVFTALGSMLYFLDTPTAAEALPLQVAPTAGEGGYGLVAGFHF